MKHPIGHVGDGKHYGREPVKRDNNHDEAGEIETNNSIEDHEPAGDIICLPRHCGTPGNLQGDLQKDNLTHGWLFSYTALLEIFKGTPAIPSF